MNTFIKMVLLCVCCLGWLTSANAKTTDESLDQIMAIVNDDVVTRSEFNQMLNMTKQQMAQTQVPVPTTTVLQKKVLDQLINKKLQLQIAKQAGINITDGELDKVIQNVAAQNQLSIQSLYERLGYEGMSIDDYRREMRDQLTLQKLQQQEVISRVTVTPDEVTLYLHSTMWQNPSSKEYHLEDILVSFSDTPSANEIAAAKTRAAQVLAQLKQGRGFSAIVAASPTGQRPLEKNDLGWRKTAEIPSAFAEQMSGMHKNDFAGPIQTANGFHILHLTASRDTHSAQNEPDRKQIENLLLQRKFEEAVQTWLSKLRSQAFIKVNVPTVQA